MDFIETLSLLATGLVAGFIDSIAGGGGLISLPSLSLFVGAGPQAIATNKIPGATAAFVALVIYSAKGHFDLKRSLKFSLWVGVGSFLGSLTSPLLPAELFKVFLIVTCPLILWVVWKKEWWVAHSSIEPHSKLSSSDIGKLILVGLACGFYDGVWGPGGGTFMLLSLLWIVKMPLLPALASAKFANTLSALVSLASYSSQGLVHWPQGIEIALGIGVGAYCGAHLAHRHTSKIVRPVLVAVSTLLLIRTLTA